MVTEKSSILQSVNLMTNGSINQNDSPDQSIKTETAQDNTHGMSKLKIIINLVIMSMAYFLFYLGFWTLTNLQSTMNGAGGLGDVSQAVIYGVSLVSSLFLPDFIIGKFGAKKVLTVCTLLGCPYLAANIYLRWDTMIVSSVLYGLINGPFVAAQAVYTEELAVRFKATILENIEVVMATFFGFLGCFSEMTQIWGNLLVYYTLQPANITNSSSTAECGIHFIPSENDTNSNLDPPPENERFILVGVFTILGLMSAVLLGFGLDPLKNDLKETNLFSRCLSAIKHLRNPHQLLLIPIAIYMGAEGPFYSNEITQAYIACSWGVHHVGFVTICFGVCGAIMSLLVGPLVKCISQMAVLILAACANVSMCVLLYLWKPTPDNVTIYFLIAGVWGMGDAIWWSQVTALYGLMFPNNREAAFSNLYFWSFLGFFISYSYANYLSVAFKINILLMFLGAGMIGYLAGQIKIKCAAKKEYVTLDNPE